MKQISKLFSELSRHLCGTQAKRRGRSSQLTARSSELLEERTVLTAPAFISMTDWSVPENDPAAATVEATDADNDPVTYSIAGTGADDALFLVDAQTGDLNFAFAPNFEQHLDADGDGVYQVDVLADDGIDGPVVQTLNITVVDVDDETPIIVSDSTVTVDEGTTFVINVHATDLDANSVLEYSLTGNGPDDFLFRIDATTGVVEFAIVTDFANPADADQNNIYEFEVQVSDGFQSATQQVQVTVKQIAANPVIAFNDGAITFKKKQAPVNIAPFFTATGNNLGGGVLVVSINNVNTGKKRADRFDTTSLALLGTQDTVLTNGRYVTTVTLFPGVTADEVQGAVRGLTFSTSKKGLKFTSRSVKIQLLDANFNVSNEITKTINVRNKP